MKATKKIAALFSAAAVAFGAWATPPTVTINSVTQDYPDSNVVKVKYNVTAGAADDKTYAVKFYATINGNVSEVTVSPATDLLTAGAHDVTWTAEANLLDANAGFMAKVYVEGDSTDPVSVAELKDYSVSGEDIPVLPNSKEPN